MMKSREQSMVGHAPRLELPSAVLAKIGQTLTTAEKALEQGMELEASTRHAVAELPTIPEKLDVGDLVEMDRALQAVLWIEKIASVGKELDDIWSSVISTSSSKKKNFAGELERVVHLHKLLVSMALALSESSCSSLRAYSIRMLDCHRVRWINKVEKSLQEDLDALKFPQCILDQDQEDGNQISIGDKFLGGRSTPDDMVRVALLQRHYRILCDFSLPAEIAGPLKGVQLSDPLGVIVMPLKKRFKFHFSGTKKTNNPEKPEWYLQQVSSWMSNSQKFFDVCIHPTRRADELSRDFPGHAQFCGRLLDLVNKKLRREILELIYDDVVISHVIDETIHFSRDVLSQDYSLLIPLDRLPLDVLCDHAVFTRWITLERKYAFEKVDELFLEEGGWAPSAARSDVAKCIITFEAILQSITSRYKSLSDVQLQLNFVDLQFELLEDFRLRLAKIYGKTHPIDQKFCLLLSSCQYLIDMLDHWSQIPVFLQLQLEKQKCEGKSEVKHKFQETKDSFAYLVNEMIQGLSEHIFYEVRSRSKEYRCDVKWFSYKVYSDPPWDITTESFPVFQLLAANLTFLSNLLTGSTLLSKVVSRICDRLSSFFLTDLILENSFSGDGCIQMQIDFERGLCALLEPFLTVGPRPRSFDELKEVCLLLNLKLPNAILLVDSLSGNNDAKSVLAEFNVDVLTPERALKFLKRRIDLQ